MLIRKYPEIVLLCAYMSFLPFKKMLLLKPIDKRLVVQVTTERDIVYQSGAI